MTHSGIIIWSFKSSLFCHRDLWKLSSPVHFLWLKGMRKIWQEEKGGLWDHLYLKICFAPETFFFFFNPIYNVMILVGWLCFFFFFVCVKLFFVFVISIKFKVMLNTLHLYFQKSLSCSAICISLKSVKGYRSIVKWNYKRFFKDF